MGDLGVLKVFSGNSNRKLALDVCKSLGISIGASDISRFPDGEISIKIEESVRGSDCFILQSTSTPANDNLMELLLLVDALKRASVNRITAVLPYYGYGRQDRKIEPRVPISAKLVANLIQVSGADRVLTMDLHAGQIQGFFDIPVDNLFSAPVIVKYIKSKKLPNLTIVSPDAGGVERARIFAESLNADLAIMDKRRFSPSQAKVMNVIGEVKGKNILIVDDMVDTGGTLYTAVNALRKSEAKRIFVACTHPILAGDALKRISSSGIEELVVTDTIDSNRTNLPCIKVLSVSKLFADAIQCVHKNFSISDLFCNAI